MQNTKLSHFVWIGGSTFDVMVLFDSCLALYFFSNQTSPFMKLLFWDRASVTWYIHIYLDKVESIHLNQREYIWLYGYCLKTAWHCLLFWTKLPPSRSFYFGIELHWLDTSKSHSDLVPPSTIHLRSNVCDRLRI